MAEPTKEELSKALQELQMCVRRWVDSIPHRDLWRGWCFDELEITLQMIETDNLKFFSDLPDWMPSSDAQMAEQIDNLKDEVKRLTEQLATHNAPQGGRGRG